MRLKGKGEMPLRPEIRRRRKTTLPPRRGADPRPAVRVAPPTPSARPLPGSPQTEARDWLVQRCLMAICINQAHAQVESARGAGGRPLPRSPPRALNRFFTILCMLQYVQAPSPPGDGSRTPQCVLMYIPSPLARRWVARVGVTG